MVRVLVPLADGFEEMEGIIIIDVLRRAGVEVIVAGLDKKEIVASRKTKHIADYTLDEVKDWEYDAIVLPGGSEGAKRLENDERIKQIIERLHQKNKVIGAICAAPNVLLKHNILHEDDVFTLHPSTLPSNYTGKYVDERVVKSRNIYTSKGPGTSFEFALSLVEELCGKEVREKVEAPMFVKR
ncbi:MAG: DJ-1/PfpI family protein [Leptospiraceae bacterium]|nr:DJ-1/PfpI family protein [Leptospiraceae bacterium]